MATGNQRKEPCANEVALELTHGEMRQLIKDYGMGDDGKDFVEKQIGRYVKRYGDPYPYPPYKKEEGK